MFTCMHTTTRRLMSFQFFCALFTSEVGRPMPSPTTSCLQVIITHQTLIFHLEVLSTTICLRLFLKKTQTDKSSLFENIFRSQEESKGLLLKQPLSILLKDCGAMSCFAIRQICLNTIKTENNPFSFKVLQINTNIYATHIQKCKG